ncbi:MAG: response regulator [Planctomycetota bacterium]|jgi:CheY-like chemotaxis protein
MNDERTRVRVLLVEDGHSRRREYRRQLEESGFEVYEAADGTEVAPLIESARPQIVVSDTDMPHVDGDQALRPLLDRGRLDGVLIIGMSSARAFEEHWRGLAHEFRHKRGIDHLGETVRAIHDDFKSGRTSGRLGAAGGGS